MCKRYILIFIISAFIFACNSDSPNSSSKPDSTIERFLPDTSTGWKAKHEFDRYISRKSLATKLRLPDLEKSHNRFTLRVWWQAAIYSPSSVWEIREQADSFTGRRLDYFPNYNEPTGIDSIHTFNLTPIVGNWKDYHKKINLLAFWKLPYHYQLQGNFGCVDGESLTIEILHEKKYRTLTYPCYMAFRDTSAYKDFVSIVDAITALR